MNKDTSISFVVIFGFLFGVAGFALRISYAIDPEKFIAGTTITLNEYGKWMQDTQNVLIVLMMVFFSLAIFGASKYFQLRDRVEVNDKTIFYKQPLVKNK